MPEKWRVGRESITVKKVLPEKMALEQSLFLLFVYYCPVPTTTVKRGLQVPCYHSKNRPLCPRSHPTPDLCACMLISFSHVWLFNPMDYIVHQAPLSMGFSRQEYWNGLPCPLPGNLPSPGIELVSLMSPAFASRFFTTWEAPLPRPSHRINTHYKFF